MKILPIRVLAVIGAALVLMIGGAVAYAAIPAADGTITACYTKPSSALRIINAESGATCKRGETKVKWNAEGQPGADLWLRGRAGAGHREQLPRLQRHHRLLQGRRVPGGQEDARVVRPQLLQPRHRRRRGQRTLHHRRWPGPGDRQLHKGNGEPFREGDVSFWRIQVTCATVTP